MNPSRCSEFLSELAQILFWRVILNLRWSRPESLIKICKQKTRENVDGFSLKQQKCLG